MGSSINETPKRHTLALVRVVWAICTKFGTVVGVTVIINCTKFWWLFEGCRFCGGGVKNCHLPLTRPVVGITGLVLPCSLRILSYISKDIRLTRNTLILSGGRGLSRPGRRRHWHSTLAPFLDTCPRNQPGLGQTYATVVFGEGRVSGEQMLTVGCGLYKWGASSPPVA